jgi:hypothetical protein
MSERVVPDMKTTVFNECSIENFDIGADDIDWCTGFWNEMDEEITPWYVFNNMAFQKRLACSFNFLFLNVLFSLYPDSPIFSSKEYNWDDPVFLENVFVTPNIEEIFVGTHVNSRPAFMENQKNEG